MLLLFQHGFFADAFLRWQIGYPCLLGWHWNSAFCFYQDERFLLPISPLRSLVALSLGLKKPRR